MNTYPVPNANVPAWSQASQADGERRLPVYVLLDVSWSMKGDPIAAIQRGLDLLRRELAEDPETSQSVRLGVLVFSDDARFVTGDDQCALVRVEEFQPPQLEAGGVTRLDLAFAKLKESIGRDVLAPVKGGRRGDWKPLVFVLTDGQPTDAEGYPCDQPWRAAREDLLTRAPGAGPIPMMTVVGCGAKVNDETLREIGTGSAFRMDSEGASFQAFFQAIAQTTRRSLHQSMSLAGTQAPAVGLPAGQGIQQV